MPNYQIAEKVTAFLVEKTGSCLKAWSGKMTAKQQKELLGRYLGKGTIRIDGATEKVSHTVKTCFGTDYDVTAEYRFDGTEVFNNRK